jgi:hypothetical protein
MQDVLKKLPSNNKFGRWGRWLTMNLGYVPLVRVMRDLHSIPRGQPPDFNSMMRFRQYLRTRFSTTTGRSSNYFRSSL